MLSYAATDSSLFTEATEATEVTRPCPGPMTRSQVMERIISINPTATVQFLGRFADRALRGYLDHLSVLQAPRGRTSPPWVRPADSPAIVTRSPED